MDDLDTGATNTWCTGCGNFGILNAFKKAIRTLEETGVSRDDIIMSADIGCHGKIFDYLDLSGYYGLHGRSMTSAQGIKLGNPNLKVINFAGDGGAMGEGLAHMLFAAKRNADITVVVHHNGVYGLTTGQVTPITPKGVKGPSTPRGSIEEPFIPPVLMLEAGATFVARGYSGKIPQLADILVQAVEHEGFSFVEVLQPCISFNDTYKLYNEVVEEAEGPASDKGAAREMAVRKDRLLTGVLYREEAEPHHRALMGERVPAIDRPGREDRLCAVGELMGSCGPDSVQKGECR